MKNDTIVNIDEIRDIFKEDCEQEGEEFSKKIFQEFLKFLEIDARDWVKENLRSFYQQRQNS